MSFTGKRPTFNTAALTPSATAPANPVTGDMYLNDGSGSIEGGLYRYNGSQFVRIDAREKNLIINGGFDFWQRGTTSTVAGYLADRFRFDHTTASITETMSRSTDVPLTSASYSLDVTATVGGSVGAAEFTIVRHFIEGYNIRELAGKPFVLSFWVKATVTGQHALSFSNAGGDRYFATSYTINTTNTWEKKYVRVPAFDLTSGTWDITTGRGLVVNFAPASGTSRLATASTTWDTGGPIDGATGSVNALATNGNIWRISNLMLTAGEDHKEDFHRSGHSIADELLLCHRYYYKSYDIATNPGTVTNLGSEDLFITEFTSVAGRSTRKSVQFATHMRSAPTITTYDLTTGTSGNWRSISGNSASTVSEIGQARARISVTDGGAASTNMLWQGHFTADAEI